MPRVSEAHLAARRQQILDAARRCFLRNGFHSTSMQDVIAEAGLSVGAVYRYFRSKTEIIAAIAEGYAIEVKHVLGDLPVDRGHGLSEVMQRAVEVIDANVGPDGMMRLAVQVWAEAMRDPAVAATLFSLVLGYALQRMLTGQPDLEGYRRGLRALLGR